MFLNKATLIGNLTRDPELKSLPNGTQVCSFSIATNETFKNAQGVKQERVEFHNVVCFGKTADNVARYMKKGNQIYIDGKIQTRSWDDTKTGEKKYRTEILANSIQFGNNKSSAKQEPSSPQAGDDVPTQAITSAPDDIGGQIDFPTDDIDPADIPF